MQMNNILYNRVLAAFIDYGIMITYATNLFLLSKVISSTNNWDFNNNPFVGQLIGFFFLTLPVVTYCYLTEKGSWKATIGKKLRNLKVVTEGANPSHNILLRNILKFVPWEISHTGVHWIIYYTSTDMETPFWIWIILITPQIVVVLYLISIFTTKGQSSIYDHISKTKIGSISLKVN